MVTKIPNMIKFHKLECGRGLMFEHPICTIPSITTYMGSNERAPYLSIQITDHEKEKYFLYKPIESVESYINVLTSCDSLLTKNGYMMGIILKEAEILKCKKAITNEEKTQKNGKMETQKL